MCVSDSYARAVEGARRMTQDRTDAVRTGHSDLLSHLPSMALRPDPPFVHHALARLCTHPTHLHLPLPATPPLTPALRPSPAWPLPDKTRTLSSRSSARSSSSTASSTTVTLSVPTTRPFRTCLYIACCASEGFSLALRSRSHVVDSSVRATTTSNKPLSCGRIANIGAAPSRTSV